MKQNFDDCLNRLLKDEGGYTNDPQDPGGPTNFGITIFDYRKYINPKGTAQDVRKMTVDQAKTIYREKYWNALNCDNLSSGLDYTCFDYGVNSGLGRPLADLKKFKDLSGVKLINAINDERLAFLQRLSTFPRFGKGWTSRVNRVRAHSLDLATQKNNAAGPAVATATVGLGTALSQYWHNHEVLIISVGAFVAVAAGFLIHYYFNKGK